MEKKLYIQPQAAHMSVAPQTIICQSVYGGGSTSSTEGQVTSGDAPKRKVNIMYI